MRVCVIDWDSNYGLEYARGLVETSANEGALLSEGAQVASMWRSREQRPTMAGGDHCLHIIKNTFNLSDVFRADGNLCVSSRLVAWLTPRVTARYLPVTIERAFCCPVFPFTENGVQGLYGREMRQLMYYDNDDTQADWEDDGVWFERLALSHPSPVPREKYFELVVHRWPDDHPEAVVVPRAWHRESHQHPPCRVVLSEIEEFGIAWERGGHFMRPDVCEILAPYIPRPFMLIRELDL